MGGIAIAYDLIKITAQGKDTVRINGLTPDQRFFLSISQIWRMKLKDEALRRQVNTNLHSPLKGPVNGPLMNFAFFCKTFNVKPGDKIYRNNSSMIKNLINKKYPIINASHYLLGITLKDIAL